MTSVICVCIKELFIERKKFVQKYWICFGLFVLSSLSMAESADSQGVGIPANEYQGVIDRLSGQGLDIDLSVTQIYQQNLRGGISKHRRAGRYNGSYDLELIADMQKLLGIEGGTLYFHSEGSWPRTDYDEIAVGSFFGINGDFSGRRSIDVTELWYEQVMLDDTVRLRIGKLDLTGGFECRGCPVSFDGSTYANDETSQFLNNALVNNPAIPFPQLGLGAIVFWNPIEWWYASIGVSDAQADVRETGFGTTFHGQDYFFYIAETGVVADFDSANGPLQGSYRVGLWYDPQPKANSDETRQRGDDVGFYISCDQLLAKENSDPEDTQGLGTFFRYGYANSNRNDLTNFFSGGVQYEGLFEGRDSDVLGLGYAQGFFADSADTTYTTDYESVFELYYNAQITSCLNISPSFQYIANPGGDDAVNDAVVFGVRAQISF
jgi:porin